MNDKALHIWGADKISDITVTEQSPHQVLLRSSCEALQVRRSVSASHLFYHYEKLPGSIVRTRCVPGRL